MSQSILDLVAAAGRPTKQLQQQFHGVPFRTTQRGTRENAQVSAAAQRSQQPTRTQQAVHQRLQQSQAQIQRIQQLRAQIDNQSTPQTWLQSRFFSPDANSPVSRLRRLEEGREEMYQDDEIARGMNPRMNLGEQIVGAPAQLANTAIAHASAIPEVSRYGIAKATGNEGAQEASRERLRESMEKRYQPDSGIFGMGTAFSSLEEAQNMSIADMAKRYGGLGLETASLAVGGRPLVAAGRQGARLFSKKGIKAAAPELKKLSASGAMGAGGYTMQDTSAGVKEILGSTAAGALAGPAFGLAAGGAGQLAKGGSSAVKTGAKNFQKAHPDAAKKLVELNQKQMGMSTKKVSDKQTSLLDQSKSKPRVTSKKAASKAEPGGQRLFKLQDELTEHSFPTNMTGTKIENTGDIFRELAKSGGKPYGRGYIGEKIYKLKTGFELDDRGFPLKNDISDIKSGRNVAKYNAEMDAWQSRLKKLEQETLKEPNTPLRKAMLDTLDLQRDVAEWYRNPSTNYGNIPKKITALEKQLNALHDATPSTPPKPTSKAQSTPKPKVTAKQPPKKTPAKTGRAKVVAKKPPTKNKAKVSDKPKTPKKKPYKTQNPSRKSRLAPKDKPAELPKRPKLKTKQAVQKDLNKFAKEIPREGGSGKIKKIHRTDNLLAAGQRLSNVRNLKASGGKLGASERLVSRIQQADGNATKRTLHYRQKAKASLKGLRKGDRVAVSELLDNPKLDLKKLSVSQIVKKTNASPRAAKAAKELRKVSDDILKEVNKARVADGRKPVSARKGHLFHMIKDKDPVFSESGFLPTEIKAGASRARTGSTKAYEMDAAKVYDRYIDMMMRDAHMTEGLNIAVVMRDILAQTPGQADNATWLTRQIQSNILGRPTEYGLLADTGVKLTPGTKGSKFVDTTNRARADSVLLASPRFAATQVLSMARTAGETGIWKTGKAAVQILKPSNRQRLRSYYSAQSKSMNSISKSGMGDVSKSTSKAWTKWLGEVHAKIENAMTLHALAAGENLAKANGFKPGTMDYKILADSVAQTTQSMYDRLNRAQVLNSKLTRTLNPFQTFSVEAWRAGKRVAGAGGGRIESVPIRAKKALNEVAAIIALNKAYEAIFLEEKTSPGSYIPFVGSMVDNAIEEGMLQYKIRNGSEEEQRRAKDELKYRDEEMTKIQRYITKPGGRFWMTAPAGHIAKIADAGMTYFNAITDEDPEAKKEYAAYRNAVREFTFWAGGVMGMPANQLFNMIDGFAAVARGYTMTGGGNIRSPITSTEDKIRAIATGQNTTRSAKESFDNNLPVLSGDNADEFRDTEDPQERQEFYDKKVRELRKIFDDRNDNSEMADEILNDHEKDILAKLDSKRPDNYKEDKPTREQMHASAARYKDLLAHPNVVEVIRDRDERARKRGDLGNPIFDKELLQEDPNHDVSRFERILLYRSGRAFREAGQSSTRDGESLYVSLGLDAKWYDDFREREKKFYEDLQETGAWEEAETRMTYSGAWYPEPTKRQSALQEKYNELPKGDGPRGGNKSRAIFLNETEEGQELLEFWARRDNFTNQERIALGLKPILKDEDGNVIDTKTGKAKTSFGSSGSGSGRGRSRGSGGRGGSSAQERKRNPYQYAVSLRSGGAMRKPRVSVNNQTRTKIPVKARRKAPSVSVKRSKV